MKLSLVFFLCLAIPYAELLLQVDFDNRENGRYTQAMLKDDWESRWGQGLNKGRTHIVGEPYAFNGKSLRVDYPQGGVGPGEGGAQWPKDLPAHEEMFVSYYLMFPEGWDGVRGGKLPGLCGAECPTGGGLRSRVQRVSAPATCSGQT